MYNSTICSYMISNYCMNVNSGIRAVIMQIITQCFKVNIALYLCCCGSFTDCVSVLSFLLLQSISRRCRPLQCWPAFLPFWPCLCLWLSCSPCPKARGSPSPAFYSLSPVSNPVKILTCSCKKYRFIFLYTLAY